MFRQRIQIGLIHSAIAITLVPINSTLNRIMIKELALSATLVALLASLPYLFSPIQIWIGSFSDRNPILGYRRTPYIVLGWLLCILGVIVSPYIAFLLASNPALGIILGTLAFGAWGMGYNFATVSYFSLATELSGERQRSRTIAVMFFMMIIAIIFTSVSLGNMLETYTQENLFDAFFKVGIAALVMGLLGLIGLEPKIKKNDKLPISEKQTWGEMVRMILGNPQATQFFIYLFLLLTAILGQDILLEPYGAEAFGLSVEKTTRITSIWGTVFLLALSVGGILEDRVSKLVQAKISAWIGIL
ncbi:MAG: BCD family MFS transporter, partial [Chloroflexota bacterium]